MQWPKDPPYLSRPSAVYRFMRFLARLLSMIWFREIDVVDDENIPSDGGIIFIAWHPSGLIDPMLMISTLPGQISTIAKHTLFKIPILGRIIKASGALPIIRANEGNNNSKNHNDIQLLQISQAVARGERLIIFPEGTTHSYSQTAKVKTGAARIMQMAMEIADQEGAPPPSLIPIGLHYSNTHIFRERAAVIIDRPMEIEAIPNTSDDGDDEPKREWVRNLTSNIGNELKRASHSSENWENRHLIWRARSIIYAERARNSQTPLVKPSYAESVLGARRLRAGWAFLSKHNPDLTTGIEEKTRSHFKTLDNYGLHPMDIDSKPDKLSAKKYLTYLASWLWAASWMCGIVTWGAVIGNLPPYYLNRLLVMIAEKNGVNKEAIGSVKVYTSIILFPIWWAIISIAVAWLIIAEQSPINTILSSHWLIAYLTYLPIYLVFAILFIWWPMSGRANLSLHANATRSWRMLKRWNRWNDGDIEWDMLHKQQLSIANTLVSIGDKLVLPGDTDWTNPATGIDDSEIVTFR